MDIESGQYTADVIDAARERGVSLHLPHAVVLVWNEERKCRAYSTHQHNLHWGVPKLDGIRTHQSILRVLSYP